MSVYIATHKPARMPVCAWLVPIGVGGFQDRHVKLNDSVGDNIAATNRMYCELTATYWLWRNGADPYIGLCHYRRFFTFEPLAIPELQDKPMVRATCTPDVLGLLAGERQRDYLERLLQSFDMVVPRPIYCYPSVATNFRDHHGGSIWEAFVGACRKEFGVIADSLEVETRFYPCNMVVAWQDVFHDYSERLFRVLEQVVDEIGTPDEVPGARYQPYRYPGYLGERFTGLYLQATGQRHATAQILELH